MSVLIFEHFFPFRKFPLSVMCSYPLWAGCGFRTEAADGNLLALVPGEVWLRMELWSSGTALPRPSPPENPAGKLCVTFGKRFNLTTLLCSVRTQQCQLCDIYCPLSPGREELESGENMSLGTAESYRINRK